MTLLSIAFTVALTYFGELDARRKVFDSCFLRRLWMTQIESIPTLRDREMTTLAIRFA